MKPISYNEINERYVSWLNDPEVNKYLEVRFKRQSMQDVLNYINGLRSKNGCEVFAIFNKQNHMHVGNLAITDYNSHYKRIEYGIMVAEKKARMLGVGGEASIIFLEYLFKKMKVQRAYGGIIADNTRSLKLDERLGFKKEGTLREHSILPNGKVSDVYIYGMLRRDWLRSRKSFINTLKYMKVEANK
jgi:RimJ/RimL family protein N-acetyltransferase